MDTGTELGYQTKAYLVCLCRGNSNFPLVHSQREGVFLKCLRLKIHQTTQKQNGETWGSVKG